MRGYGSVSGPLMRSPLLEAGFTKREIRELSQEFGLPTWDKPAAACLASRVPYHEPITPYKLEQIERTEELLKSQGIRQLRVRVHGDLARIEVASAERVKFFNTVFLDRIASRFREMGFRYVALDLEGYRTGKLNGTTAEGDG